MNALDTVRLIQEATERATGWPRPVREAVLLACPVHVAERGYSTLEWLTTVEVFRLPYETAPTAAQRLARYLLAHAERWHKTPTLARVQEDALERLTDAGRTRVPTGT